MEEPGRAGERRAEPSDSQNRGEAIEELKVIRRGYRFLILPEISAGMRGICTTVGKRRPVASCNQTLWLSRSPGREPRRKGALWSRRIQLVADLCLTPAVRQQPPLQSFFALPPTPFFPCLLLLH